MKKDHFLFERKNDYFAVPIDEVSEIIETKITNGYGSTPATGILTIPSDNLPLYSANFKYNAYGNDLECNGIQLEVDAGFESKNEVIL